jgi:hypothetical protein
MKGTASGKRGGLSWIKQELGVTQEIVYTVEQ